MENENKITQSVPNSTATLVLGIISIALCWCYGIVGIVLGIIALVISKKGKEVYTAEPDKYTESSYKNLKAGRICAIIGLSLSALYVIYLLVILMFYGAVLSSLPWEEMIQESNNMNYR